MFLTEIVKVLYSPLKAFKEIAQNPKYWGPVLIAVLFVAAYSASAYIVFSRAYDERTLPTSAQGDYWTENSTDWTSNGNISQSTDGVTGSFFGNKSIQFSASNTTSLWMQLNLTEHIDCQSSDGYHNVSVRLKLADPSLSQLENVTLYLLSSLTDYFYYNLTAALDPSGGITWNNLTILVGPDAEWKNGSLSPNWGEISGLRFGFHSSASTNWTARLDGLFFRDGYKPLVDNMPNYVASFSAMAFMIFSVKWFLLAALLFLVGKVMGGKTVWKPLLVIVGFALVTSLVLSVANVVIYSTLPAMVRYPLEAGYGPAGESERAMAAIQEQTALVSQVGWYVARAVDIWTVALCAIAVRVVSELSWTKSGVVATVAYLASLLVQSFLLGF